MNSHTLLLWLAPLLVLATALMVILRAMRRPVSAAATAATAAPLSEREEEELTRVLDAARGPDGKAG
jgi:cytochrome c-type biogenesis protein CcmH/NrfF